jgi:hypothetical protein
MQLRHFRTGLSILVVMLVMAASLVVLGCSDDDDEDFQDAGLADLAGRTFTFPATFFTSNAAVATQTVTVTFANTTNAAGALPFTMTFGNTTGTGVATVGTITLTLNQPLIVLGVNLGTTFPNLVVEVNQEDNTITIRWFNPATNVTITFTFTLGGPTGATGTTGT